MTRPEFGSINPLAGVDGTRRLHADATIKAGFHPLTQRKLLPIDQGKHCKDCAHLVMIEYARRYYKCEIGPLTHGRATDCRVNWPACEGFLATDKEAQTHEQQQAAHLSRISIAGPENEQGARDQDGGSLV